MIFTFYKARGLSVGNSLVEDDKLELAKALAMSTWFLCWFSLKQEFFIFDASHPRPQTPSVGWIKILPSFSQFDAAAGDENSFKLIY